MTVNKPDTNSSLDSSTQTLDENNSSVDETRGESSYAAIDLGSNSFHMVVATPEGRSIRIIDSLRAPVRLAAGLDEKKRIKAKTQKLALETLNQFAERLQGVPVKNIRVVGTNTLRRAKNSRQFTAQVHEIIGRRIDIISGREEARLIFESVAHTQPDSGDKRLVIDIGGGSTELVTGSGTSADVMESFNMGCVSSTQTWFSNSVLDVERFRGATVHAQLELQPLAVAFKQSGWDTVYGCSGTIKATGRILHELGISESPDTFSAGDLKKLQKKLVKSGSVDKLQLESISDDRKQVICGGICILCGIMKTLDIKRIQVSQVALREGLIFDMIGKVRHADIQSHTVENIASRFQIDKNQADRVERLSLTLLSAARKHWKLDEQDESLLLWASRLHEIGMSVAHTQYHKHGAYLLENADLMGFTQSEQISLAMLVRFHRRKLAEVAFEELSKNDRERMMRLTTLLRLAVLLNRPRLPIDYSELKFVIKSDRIQLKASESWFESRPLTCADLEDEARHLDNIGFELRLSRN